MFGIFKAKSIISEQDFQFQIESYRWLLRHFGGDDFYNDARLILPTREYFPAQVDSREEAAALTFAAVKKYAGLEEWPCKLEMQEEDINPLVAPTIAIQNMPNNPNGTFSLQDKEDIVISYNPSLSSNPLLLVATFAHELAHYSRNL